MGDECREDSCRRESRGGSGRVGVRRAPAEAVAARDEAGGLEQLHFLRRDHPLHMVLD